ncbi:MAG: hypothetical protein RR795_01185 [Cetobacterium sp.]|uniref:hypothetical protein n=1 Tax=Cetobacterium sp. TaxID=2071632 RepID=UPI002FC887F0
MNKNWHYICKEHAKKGIVLCFATFLEKKENYEEYFDNRAIEVYGEIPHFITYIEKTNSIRKATDEEKLERNQRKLAENEVVINGKIISYNTYSQKIVDNNIIDKIREDYIREGLITLESEKEKARLERDKQFKSLDLYDKAVLRGDVKETENMKIERDIFRKSWLEVPNNYKNLNIPIEEFYPIEILNISYFL